MLTLLALFNNFPITLNWFGVKELNSSIQISAPSYKEHPSNFSFNSKSWSSSSTYPSWSLELNSLKTSFNSSIFIFRFSSSISLIVKSKTSLLTLYFLNSVIVFDAMSIKPFCLEAFLNTVILSPKSSSTLKISMLLPASPIIVLVAPPHSLKTLWASLLKLRTSAFKTYLSPMAFNTLFSVWKVNCSGTSKINLLVGELFIFFFIWFIQKVLLPVPALPYIIFKPIFTPRNLFIYFQIITSYNNILYLIMPFK